MDNREYDFGVFNVFNEELIEKLLEHINNTSNPHNVKPGDIGLGNVNNTSDLDKPISNATSEAIQNVENELNAVDENLTQQIADIYSTLNPKVLTELDYIARTIAELEAELARRSLSKCIGLINTLDDINNMYPVNGIIKGQYYWINRDVYIDFTEEEEDLDLYLKKGNRLVAKKDNIGKETLIEIAKALKASGGESSENDYWALVTSNVYGEYLIDLEDIIEDERIRKLEIKLNKEINRASTNEQTINDRITTNIEEFTQDINEVQSNIDQEAETRLNGDNALSTLIDTEKEERRINDNTLSNRIRVIENDYLTSDDKNAILTTINQEKESREAADELLSNRLRLIENDYLTEEDKTELSRNLNDAISSTILNIQTFTRNVINDYDNTNVKPIYVRRDYYDTDVLEKITTQINNESNVPTGIVYNAINTLIDKSCQNGSINSTIDNRITNSSNVGAIHAAIVRQSDALETELENTIDRVDLRLQNSINTTDSNLRSEISRVNDNVNNINTNLTNSINDVREHLDDKQDTVVAGNGISIASDNKTISVTIPIPEFPAFEQDTSFTLKLFPNYDGSAGTKYILEWVKDNDID